MTKQEDFLLAHNELSPVSLQATLVLLDQFKEQKINLFKDDSWSLDKLRRPFIIWLTALAMVQKKASKDAIKNHDNQKFNTYPYPYDES